MISSFVLSILGYSLLAVVVILDKFILTETVKGAAVYTFYSTIFFFALAIAIPFSGFIIGFDLLWALISGLAFGFGLWTTFIALEHGEASHITPFVGAVVAVAAYFLSHFFLRENLGSLAQLGLFLLVISCLLLSFEKSLAHDGFHIGFVWGGLSGILFAISHVTAKHVYDIYPFLQGLVWTKIGIGLVGLLPLFSSHVRSQLFQKKMETAGGAVMITDKVLGIVGVLLIQYAISIGSVTVVNALAGIQYALTFVFIYLLTKLTPKLFSEYFTKRELLIQTLAILLVVLGTYFLQHS